MLGLELVEWMLSGRIPSGWIIDVWNCHGVLKPQDYAGYGNQSDDILEVCENHQSAKYEWFNCGYYTVPLRTDIREKIEEAGLIDELAKRLEKVLDWIVYDCNGGAINMSGFYMVSTDELVAIEKVIQRVLRKATQKDEDINNVADALRAIT